MDKRKKYVGKILVIGVVVLLSGSAVTQTINAPSLSGCSDDKEADVINNIIGKQEKNKALSNRFCEIEDLGWRTTKENVSQFQNLKDKELKNICCIVFGVGKGFRVTPFTGLMSWFGGELTGSEFIQNHPLLEFAITGILGGCGAFAMFRPRIGAPLSAFVVLDGALGTIGLLGITEDTAVDNWGHPNPSGFVIIGFLGIWISILSSKLVPYTLFIGIALAVI